MPGAMADRVSPQSASARAVDDFRHLLAPGAIRAVFQPIVRLADLQPIGYEGLARFPTPPGLDALPPDVTLAAAARQGVRQDLEVACWAAISEAGTPPAGRLLFINVAPEALGHPGLLELAAQLPERLVIELTEQDAVQNTAQLRERLRPWIARGTLVAIDDAGAGFTSLEYVADLRPDFLKLCRGMVTGVDLDRAARPSCAPRSRSRARSAPALSRRASSAPRSSRCCATPTSTTARAGCSAARPRPGPRSPRLARPRRRGRRAAASSASWPRPRAPRRRPRRSSSTLPARA